MRGGEKVSYSNWMSKEEMMKQLTAITPQTTIEKSGLPILYDNDTLYIDQKEAHNLIIGATGSGKTQVSILPTIHLAMKAGESIVVNDVKGELYEHTASALLEEGYQVIVLNFEDAKTGNSWNPLTFPYELYQKGEIDKAYERIEDLGYYLLFDPKDRNPDPFWFNSTRDYFTGLVLYLFEHAKKEEIHLLSVMQLHNYLNQPHIAKEFLESLDSNSSIYSNFVGTLNAPPETKGSIISVFRQRIKKYVSKEILTNMLSFSDFDITNISNQKTALFMISGSNHCAESLIPLLVHQIVSSVDIYGKKEKICHILLDEFDGLLPIRHFNKMIEFARSIYIRFTVAIRSYQHLSSMYSKEDSALLKLCFGNIIYLLSNDIYTLEEISNYCGNTYTNGKIEPLITIEELKLLKPFEAIILMPRRLPFRTELLPDYKINWGYKKESKEIPLRKSKEISIFKIENENKI